MWGKSFKNLKQIEPDDILRLFGIFLTDDDNQDYVSNLTGDTFSGKRPNIDANKGWVIASYYMLLGKFTDWEVTVVLTSKWADSSMQAYIDLRKQPGTYNAHGNFDPNNKERMKLP
jgi:hypothetical protein